MAIVPDINDPNREAELVRQSIFKKVGPTDSKPTEEESLLQEIVETIKTMDPDDDSHYTSSGKPHTAYLSEVLGKNISAAMRDDAFKIYENES